MKPRSDAREIEEMAAFATVSSASAPLELSA